MDLSERNRRQIAEYDRLIKEARRRSVFYGARALEVYWGSLLHAWALEEVRDAISEVEELERFKVAAERDLKAGRPHVARL